MPTSRNTLLRLVRGLPDPEVGAVSVLGVDDFALRRNRRYGTVLIGMSTRRPVDVLADQEANTFADWLAEHPGTEVICRDRAGAYAEGARAGAPEATRSRTGGTCGTAWPNRWRRPSPPTTVACARRRHRPRNRPRRRTLRRPWIWPRIWSRRPEAVHADRRNKAGLVTRSTTRFEQVQALKAQGKGIKPIMRELGLAKETVRKFYRATSVEEVTATSRAGRPSMLDEFKPYLHERFNSGISNVSALFRERPIA
jgi:hypothetical protein